MEYRDFVSLDDVRAACSELGISDWSERRDDHVGPDEAAKILEAVNQDRLAIPLETFVTGLSVELEHGVRYPDANVTNNHPIVTGRIVLAHLHESLDYYRRITVAELEGDLVASVRAGDADATKRVLARLLEARQRLDRAIAEGLGG